MILQADLDQSLCNPHTVHSLRSTFAVRRRRNPLAERTGLVDMHRSQLTERTIGTAAKLARLLAIGRPYHNRSPAVLK